MENVELGVKKEVLVEEILTNFLADKYSEGLDLAHKAQMEYIKAKNSEYISIALSLIGLLEYFSDNSKYLKALVSLNDAKSLADSINSKEAKLFNEYSFGKIELNEKNYKEASSFFANALKYAKNEDNYGLIPVIEKNIDETTRNQHLSQKRDPLVALLKISQTVAAETDIDTLLKVIAEETKSAIQADRCSVFLYDKENNELWSKVALGIASQEIRFPANKGLAGHVVMTGEKINIKDAYSDSRFNPEIDKQTGYKTKNILCMPIKNLNQEIIGAFQVLNKFEGAFNEEDEDLLIAIGSNAGIALENAQLFKKQAQMLDEQKQIFNSFIDTLAMSIDARDSITAGHSLRVKLYSGLIARALKFTPKQIEIIETAAILHDIGKIGVKDAVLQKDGKLTDEEYKHIQQHAELTHNILQKIHMSEDFKLVTEIACSHHEKYNGTGYYRHLAGEEIPLGGRILAVSDVFDAITSKRHYRDKMPINNVINIIIKDSGSHFDKDIADCFLHIPAIKIVGVFLTENHMKMKDEYAKVLEKYNLLDLHEFLSKENPDELTEEQKAFISAFQHYYTSKSSEEENA